MKEYITAEIVIQSDHRYLEVRDVRLPDGEDILVSVELNDNVNTLEVIDVLLEQLEGMIAREYLKELLQDISQ